MKIVRLVSILVWLCATNLLVLADSPITSTPFASVYSGEKIIVEATKAKGFITPGLVEYLSKPNNPIEVKMAVINQLGWQSKIKDNGYQFLRAISLKNKYKTDEDFKQKGSADELLAMAYLLAMDDFQEVAPAIKYADLALAKNPKSLTFNLIAGLIKAQKAMDGDWCDIYKIVDSVRGNSDLIVDFKADATTIIYKYTDGYREFCKNPTDK